MVFTYLLGLTGPSGFGSASTSEQVADTYKDAIKGRVFVVTGCSSGIGQETALQLAKHGGTVVMACRNVDKMKRAANDIRSKVPDAKLHELTLELGNLASIKDFVVQYKALKLPGLNCLINNAGVMACPLSYTKDGFENQIGSNHLGHFYLTNLLKDELKKGQPSRVVCLASTAHHMAYKEGIRLDDLEGKKYYEPWGSYGQSKLANILHAQELDKRCKAQGLDISAYSVHPGVIQTELSRHMGAALDKVFGVVANSLGKSIPQGAATTLYCALAPGLEKDGSGKYYADCNVDEVKHASLTADPQLPAKLWKKSVELTSSDFP